MCVCVRAFVRAVLLFFSTFFKEGTCLDEGPATLRAPLPLAACVGAARRRSLLCLSLSLPNVLPLVAASKFAPK